MPHTHRTLLAIGPALLLLAAAAVACGEGGRPSPATETPTPTTATAQATASATPQPSATARPPAPTATSAPTPPPSGVAQVVRRGDPGRMAVALTFDAGADAGFTTQILDTLRANRIVASFGITGRWAQGNPELLRRIVRDGHELINHSYDHASFTGLSTGAPPLTRAERWEQLDRTESIVQGITGTTTRPSFRPPYGDYDDSVNTDVYARGYRYTVMWTVDSQGWNGLPADGIVERCLSLAQPGAIYVFHVGSASQDAAALQLVVEGLRARGYDFVPISSFAPP